MKKSKFKFRQPPAQLTNPLKPAIIYSISFLLLTILLVAPAAASVDWDISPNDPSIGDTLVIRGTASPDEKIKVEVSFEKEAPVSGGEYEYEIAEVKIPDGEDNRFTVRAEGVNDLYVRVKKLMWFTLSADASNGVASITQSHVPAWTYRVKIDGAAQSGKSTVDLKITAAQTIEADSDGEFEYSYKTSSMPAGDFTIKVGSSSKTITLKSGGSGSSSSGGMSSGSMSEPESTSMPEPTPITEETDEETEENEEIITGTEETEIIEITPIKRQDNNSTESVPEPQKSPAVGIFGAALMLIIYSRIKRI